MKSRGLFLFFACSLLTSVSAQANEFLALASGNCVVAHKLDLEYHPYESYKISVLYIDTEKPSSKYATKACRLAFHSTCAALLFAKGLAPINYLKDNYIDITKDAPPAIKCEEINSPEEHPDAYIHRRAPDFVPLPQKTDPAIKPYSIQPIPLPQVAPIEGWTPDDYYQFFQNLLNSGALSYAIKAAIIAILSAALGFAVWTWGTASLPTLSGAAALIFILLNQNDIDPNKFAPQNKSIPQAYLEGIYEKYSPDGSAIPEFDLRFENNSDGDIVAVCNSNQCFATHANDVETINSFIINDWSKASAKPQEDIQANSVGSE